MIRSKTRLPLFIILFILLVTISTVLKANLAVSISSNILSTNNCKAGATLTPDEICTSGLYPTGVNNNFIKLPVFSIDKHYQLANVTNDAGYYSCQPGIGTPTNPKFPAPAYRLDEYNSSVTYSSGLSPSNNYSGAVTNGSYAGSEIAPNIYPQYSLLNIYYHHPYGFTTPTASWISADTFGHDYSYFFNSGLTTSATGQGFYSNLDPDLQPASSRTFPMMLPGDYNHLYDPIKHPNGICFNPSDSVIYNSAPGGFNINNPQSGIDSNTNNSPNQTGPIYKIPNYSSSVVNEPWSLSIPSPTYIYSIHNAGFSPSSRNKFFIKLGPKVNKSNLTLQLAGQADNALAVMLNGCYLSAENNLPLPGTQAFPVDQTTLQSTGSFTNYEASGFSAKAIFDFSLGSCQLNTGNVGNTLEFYLKSNYDLTAMIITSIAFTDQLPSTVPLTHPYFTVSTGDISAGNNLQSTGACVTTPNSSIQSWNNNNNSTGDYFGAGSQGAAYATGNIASFFANLKSGSRPPPYNLSFANNTSTSTVYGGNLTSQPCLTNYYNSLLPSANNTISPGGVNLSTLSSGLYKVSGNLIINSSSNIAPGKNITILVNGSATIVSNILYSSYQLNNIPRINIIVNNGNLNISSYVTELHGFYSSSKSFITCYDTSTNNESTSSTVCNHPLKIYGSVFANTINLDRSYGNQLNQTSPAEIFDNSPEFWIPASSSCTITNCISNNFLEENNLPPIL